MTSPQDVTPPSGPNPGGSTPRRPVRQAWRPLAVSAVGALVLSATLFGARATVALPPGSLGSNDLVRSGTLLLTLTDRGAGYTQPVTALAPGDTAQRTVTLRAPGTLTGRSLTLQLDATPASALTDALRISLDSCPTPWSAEGTCAGPISPLLPTTPIPQLSSPGLLNAGELPAGAVLHVRTRLTLAASSGNEVAGRAADLRWTYALRQA